MQVTAEQAKRLMHIKAHLDNGFDVDQLVGHVRNGTGNPRACLMSLASHAEASAMLAWFIERDLPATRNWFREAARLDQRWYQMAPDVFGPGSKALQLLRPLMSGDEALIEWFAHYDAVYDAKRVHDHRTHDFWAYQAVLALREDWSQLAARCDRVLQDPPAGEAERKYLPDHQFYGALSRGDLDGMQGVLEALLQPKFVSARRNDESGFAADLIFTPAVLYAKLAWRRGCRLTLSSPLMPMEWLETDTPPRFQSRYGI